MLRGLGQRCYVVFVVNTERVHLTVRVSSDGAASVDEIAGEWFEGRRSQALRTVLALGLAAWRVGCRRPDDVGKVGS